MEELDRYSSLQKDTAMIKENHHDRKKDPIVISCNILKREIIRLIESGRLKADVTFLNSKLHYD